MMFIGGCSEDSGRLLLMLQDSTSAPDVAQRSDVSLSTCTTNHPTGPNLQLCATPPSCPPYADTMNAEHASSSSAIRPSHIAVNSLQRKDNRGKLSHTDKQKFDGEGQVSRSRETGPSRTWKDVGKVLDRLFFWLMLTAMTSCTVMVVLAPVYKQQFAEP